MLNNIKTITSLWRQMKKRPRRRKKRPQSEAMRAFIAKEKSKRAPTSREIRSKAFVSKLDKALEPHKEKLQKLSVRDLLIKNFHSTRIATEGTCRVCCTPGHNPLWEFEMKNGQRIRVCSGCDHRIIRHFRPHYLRIPFLPGYGSKKGG
jgi:hypothetical protein